MDIIYQYIEKTDGVTKEEVVELIKYIESEKYDTDSLFYDVKESILTSNICKSRSQIFSNTLYQYIKHLQGITYI